MHRPNGNVYDGMWVNGKQEGDALTRSADSDWTLTVWKEGVLINDLGPASIEEAKAT